MLEVRVARRLGALDLRVDLQLDRETIVVAGPNAAGKSSLLRLLLGVLRPDSGRVALDGSVLFDAAARVDVPVEERQLGYVPQDYALFPHLDVLENVMFGLRSLSRDERLRRAKTWLDRLGASHLSRRPPGELSGGERQRVALARALAREPRTLLLDEPFASLDLLARREVRRALRAWLREWRLPALIVSHDPADAVLGDRIAVLESGRIVQQGTVDELRQSPASEFVAGLLDAAPSPDST
ncbi:MAG TPA: ATP-binding cassette domain-containing protein [Myxococcales bacterium]|nr:ATP-binding cassette domain-containing protein [Myxococcales bacterium]